ncbi:hypothetical protein [Streptomyces sp. NPDC088730]|uniref:hypothetical protein n=1 Tax=Streptomyces sp. NPDC088730 TaxID=3365877 RepID=UPI0038281617
MGAPTTGSVHRTVPGGSVAGTTGAVFVLSQIGAWPGIAVVALPLQDGGAHAAPTAGSYRGTFWWPAAAAVVVFAAGLLRAGPVPDRPGPTPPRARAERDDAASGAAVPDRRPVTGRA